MRRYELSEKKLKKFKSLEEITVFLKSKNRKKTCYSFIWGGIIMCFLKIIYISKTN
jgi:hypothetical protein